MPCSDFSSSIFSLSPKVQVIEAPYVFPLFTIGNSVVACWLGKWKANKLLRQYKSLKIKFMERLFFHLVSFQKIVKQCVLGYLSTNQ